MTEILFKAAGLAVAGMVLTVLLKKQAPELGVLLALFVSCTILLLSFELLGEVFGFMRGLIGFTGLSEDVVLPVVKTAGIAIVTKITADLCRDAKESGIASGIEMAGAVIGLYVVLPLFQSLLDLTRALL